MRATFEFDRSAGAGLTGAALAATAADDGTGLTLLAPSDLPRMVVLFQRLAADCPWFWADDVLLAGPKAMQQMFANVFAAANGAVFELLDDQGVIAFNNVVPGWKATAHVAVWGRPAMRRHDLLRRAAKVVVDANDLLVVEGFTPRHHHLALRNAKNAGMRFRGWMRDAVRYNGQTQDLGWFEITREELERADWQPTEALVEGRREDAGAVKIVGPAVLPPAREYTLQPPAPPSNGTGTGTGGSIGIGGGTPGGGGWNHG